METLSNQIHSSDSFSVRGLDVIAVGDIKPFIKKLKETIAGEHIENNEANMIFESIDMLVGDAILGVTE